MINHLCRIILISLSGFLAITAIAGGSSLLLGLNLPPVELLNGSPFNNYVLPGLVLFVIVGGNAALATILLIQQHHSALHFVFVSAMFIIIFEVVEIYTIGAPEGIARNLQVFYLALGVVIASLSWVKKRISKERGSS